jgi:hypothetical protein
MKSVLPQPHLFGRHASRSAKAAARAGSVGIESIAGAIVDIDMGGSLLGAL